MSEKDIATVAVAEILQTGLLPHAFPPAPYVLVVEDEHVIPDTLAVILRGHGYAVTVAYDADSALETAELAAPQLVVSDFALPGSNGVELALGLRELVPDCRVILITGVPEQATRFLVRRPMDLPVFAKPIQPPELLKAISDLLPCTGQRDRFSA